MIVQEPPTSRTDPAGEYTRKRPGEQVRSPGIPLVDELRRVVFTQVFLPSCQKRECTLFYNADALRNG